MACIPILKALFRTFLSLLMTSVAPKDLPVATS
jgi:hypothetical protein